jgi:hypothetical protein
MPVALLTVAKLELKYCERCGGLFFRKSESEEVQCCRCKVEIQQQLSSSRLRREG